MAAFKERKKKQRELHRAIFEQDESKIFVLAEQRPGLDPLLIGGMIVGYACMKADSRGRHLTPLLVAIHFGELKMCEYLIEEEADVNWGSLHGMGPLCLALDYKHYEIAKLLIKAGANVHVPDQEGKLPMHHAIKEDSPISVVKDILSAGFPKDGIILDRIKSRPLTRAISVRNVPVVKFLLEQNVDTTSCTLEGTSPLNIAISHISPEITKLLIDHGVSLEGHFKKDAPPLFLAVQTEDTRILKILLDAGVDVNRLFTPLKYVHNALIIPYITAFQLAATCCNLPAAKLLFEHGANINANNPFKNGTAIHLVFATELSDLNSNQKIIHRKVIQFLLENGANVNAKDKDGLLPIHSIIWSKNWIALEEYIMFGANVNERISKKVGSIFLFVIINKVVTLIDLCLAFGADSFKQLNGEAVYYTAIKTDIPDILRTFWRYNHPFDDYPSEKTLKRYPRIYPVIKNQHTLFQGILSNDPKIVKKALANGAEAKCCSKEVRYTLHFCSARGFTEIVDILLENGVPIGKLNREGRTALHEAARAGHLETCKVLLRHGACFNYRGPGGATPRQQAQQAGHEDVVRLLQNATRFFITVRAKNTKIMADLEKLGSEELYAYMNCVNNRGNTLLGEAVELGLKDISEGIIALRLKSR